MPDGDHIYGKLGQAFEGPYQEICEWSQPLGDLASHFIGALRTALKYLGDEPLVLLERVAEQCEQLPQEVGSLAIDWRDEKRICERSAREIQGTKRGMDIALEVCKVHLHQMQQGHLSSQHHFALNRAYLQRVFQAEFEEKRPIGTRHEYRIERETFFVDEATFCERLNQVRPHLHATFDAWARAMTKTQTVINLRGPLHAKTRVTAETDLLAGWS